MFGYALALAGRHHIQVSEAIPLADSAGISLIAWVKPTDLSNYREIFRKEDGKDRVLFSFQNDGKVLSLGLNTGRYEECDAKIDPGRVLDGRWHHCAATFDGRWMRVYLDGDEIGSLERPGLIRSGGGALGCIGSSNGGENFQGELDDLRIYAAPLDRDEIASLYRAGLEVIERLSGRLAQQAAQVYRRGSTFAETLIHCRKQILEQQLVLDGALAQLITARLKADFAQDYDDFLRYAGVQPREYLAHGAADYHIQAAERQIEMLLEYKPITGQQWRRQTPEDMRKWKELDAYRGKFEMIRALGEAGRFSPAWVELLVEAGRRIDLRPMDSEPVAPYVRPETPRTRNVAAAEAREILERDWLFQAGGPDPAADPR